MKTDAISTIVGLIKRGISKVRVGGAQALSELGQHGEDFVLVFSTPLKIVQDAVMSSILRTDAIPTFVNMLNTGDPDVYAAAAGALAKFAWHGGLTCFL